VIDCGRGERKHRIAEDYLAVHTVAPGLFLILVAEAPASVWQVQRTRSGVIRNLAKRTAFVNHYSFHLMDPDWGHLLTGSTCAPLLVERRHGTQHQERRGRSAGARAR
jgi:hypothetical protein